MVFLAPAVCSSLKAGQVSAALYCTLRPDKGAQVWKEQLKVKETVWCL